MISLARYNRRLDRLERLIQKRPLTAKAIAAEMGCCVPTAHERLSALEKRGTRIYTVKVTVKGQPGPRSLAYGIHREG